MHDAAIAAWSVKGYYDYVRPVSALRYLAKRGQSSDPNLPGYDKQGIPLVDNIIEVVQKGDVLAKNEFLVFEQGPSEDVTLQWATFQDASDQSSLSRIWGGIHPPVDDVPGRKIGIKVAQRAVQRAASYFAGNPAAFISGKSINDFGGSECLMTATYED